MLRTPVKSPPPPYYSVTTTATLNDEHNRKMHSDLGVQLYGEAKSIEGFLGWEVSMESDFAIAISYWQSLDAIDTWRHHDEHKAAKTYGPKWFSHCMTRVALVERDYGFTR